MESQYLIERRLRMLGIKQPEEKRPVKKIAFHSKKRETKQRVYRKIVKSMHEESDLCEIHSPVCTGRMQGADHIQKRSELNLLIRNNLKRACNACQDYKEKFPEWAKENGHSISKFNRA